MISRTLSPIFGPKHKEYISRAIRSTISVAEGAVRAGKTVDNIAAFAWMIDHGTPDRIHLCTGSTSANAKLNIGDANGFGLEYIFRGRSRWTKYKGNEALVIQSHGREYVVIFAGAAKADSYKKVRGNSYGMWIATEINLHHPDTIKEAFNRQLAAKVRRVFWDLNPSAPMHWIYEEYIDRFPEQFGDKYTYQHFTIHDNASIPQRRIDEIIRQYTPGTVWYRRDILGERCTAEGLVYRVFADDTERFIVDHYPPVSHATIGVDFGGGTSAHSFSCVGFMPRMAGIALLADFREKNALTPAALENRFVEFVAKCKSRWVVADCYCDSAEQTLINGLRRAVAQAGIGLNIHNARKKPINDRIRATTYLMDTDRFKIFRGCEDTINALRTALWNPKVITEDERLDDGTTNIDSLDSMEYAFEGDINSLVGRWI